VDEARCPYCSRTYSDAGGLLGRTQRGLAAAPVLVLAGCGACGRLFVVDGSTTPADEDLTARRSTSFGRDDRYLILKRVGAGAMGETFKALDRATDSIVCVKRLHTLQPGLARALRQEAAALLRLQHAHVVRLLDLDLDADSPLLVMEYVAGQTLGALARRLGSALPEALAVHLATRICEALVWAAGREVIHCDLKPDNVLLELAGGTLSPKILDFGLAIVGRYDADGVTTGVGRVAGTPWYMAPEQLEGALLTPACDVYALGVILHELLSGRCAFAGCTDWGAVHAAKKRLTAGLDPPASCAPAVGGAIRASTRADPALRPSASELLEALRGAGHAVDAPAVLAPVNLGFDERAGGGLPPGWFDGRGHVAGVSIDYEVSLLRRADRASGAHVELRGPTGPRGQFGSLMQRCPARHIAGRRLRLRGELKAEEVEEWAGLWLRVDDAAGENLFFDNMSERPLRGRTPWTSCSIELALPARSAWLNYGLLLVGSGLLWADDIALEVERADGGWTTLAVDHAADQASEVTDSSALLT
jgi:serine/threonine protein kinase